MDETRQVFEEGSCCLGMPGQTKKRTVARLQVGVQEPHRIPTNLPTQLNTSDTYRDKINKEP